MSLLKLTTDEGFSHGVVVVHPRPAERLVEIELPGVGPMDRSPQAVRERSRRVDVDIFDIRLCKRLDGALGSAYEPRNLWIKLGCCRGREDAHVVLQRFRCGVDQRIGRLCSMVALRCV